RIIPLMAATMLAAGAVLLLKCCRVDNVVKYIEWELLLVIGCTMVFSTAITNTGAAAVIADGVLDLCGNNPYVVMAVMCLLASVISEFISDVGAAAALFPIIWQQVAIMGCNPMPFIVSLMLCVSFSYSTPIGSPTHMLIFGPGSLRFTDFAKIGIRLHIIMLVLCLLVVNLIYPMYK
ncbi:MAG: anion permease, partial [Bacteroidaceae bacterium]|nr:anion permease [Bacteroidaceae bacterium]